MMSDKADATNGPEKGSAKAARKGTNRQDPMARVCETGNAC
jgi:hypothetical protein